MMLSDTERALVQAIRELAPVNAATAAVSHMAAEEHLVESLRDVVDDLVDARLAAVYSRLAQLEEAAARPAPPAGS